MPLYCYPAEKAFENRRANDCAHWPQRGQGNRIEPIARLRIEAPFQLEPGASVFTVGSCFARNIEAHLEAQKFKVPMRELTRSPIFHGVPLEAVNNYSTPSIFNEFYWALESGGEFDPSVHCFETSDGMFVDLHLGTQLKPLPLDTIRRQREAVSRAYATVLDCDFIIMTLGLSEVWFDTESECYINHTPLPNITRLAPSRFELHVLSYEEVKYYIFQTLQLLVRRCIRPPKLILTVSPVPLSMTFRTSDVAVANSYSKAVLRAAAEEAASSFEFVSYYPSFESIMLSERSRTWMSDQVHVTPGIVAVQVTRMLRNYAPDASQTDGNQLSEAEAAEKANSPMSWLDAQAFFHEYAEKYAGNQDILSAHVRHLINQNDFFRARILSEGLHGSSQEILVLKAKCLRLDGRPQEALKLIEPLLGLDQRSAETWGEAVSCYAECEDLQGTLSMADQWFKVMPFPHDLYLSRPHVARAIMKMDALRAAELLHLALADNSDNYLARQAQAALQALHPAENQ